MTLKPCDYCKSDDVNVENCMGVTIQVQCASCGAAGPSFEIRKKVGDLWAREAAIKSWNTGKAVQP